MKKDSLAGSPSVAKRVENSGIYRYDSQTEKIIPPIFDAEKHQLQKQTAHCPRLIIDADGLQEAAERSIREHSCPQAALIEA